MSMPRSSSNPMSNMEQNGDSVSKQVNDFTQVPKLTQMNTVKSLIMECARAIAENAVKEAYTLVNSLRQQASSSGTAEQRLAHHFAEALAAKTLGTGSMLLMALASQDQPSIDEFFEIYRCLAEVSPVVGLSVFFTNQMILEETDSARRMHIVDFGIGCGYRFLCLLKDLSQRPGGPPSLRITGVEFPHHHDVVRGRELHVKLQRYARQVGMEAEFHFIESDSWDELRPSDLKLCPEDTDEVLVITCIYRLRHLRDEPSVADTPRKRLLANVKRMNPRVFIHAALPYNCNSPSFVSRVHASLSFYSAGFESLEEIFQDGSPAERQIIESMTGLDILNALGCDDKDRVERPEGYRKWQTTFQRAGFRQLKLRSHVFMKATEMTQTYRGNFKLSRRGNWLLVYWKENLLAAMTAWIAG